MRTSHIPTSDLNLLPSLVVLLDERHVSRAAARLGLSQPAMSRALQRLRRQFADELLVRGPDGYSLTPRAKQIRAQLADVFAGLNVLYGTDKFEPANTSRTFRVAMSDYIFSMFGPRLAQTIVTESPCSSISFEAVDAQVFEKLDFGNLDLAIYGRAAPKEYPSELLFTDQLACLVAADHPLADTESITLTQYVEWPHLAIDLAQADIERAVHRHGYSVRTVVEVPFGLLGAAALPGTQLILTLGVRLLPCLAHPSTRIIMAPPELGNLQFTSIWHPRVHNDASNQWLRSIVRDIARSPCLR